MADQPREVSIILNAGAGPDRPAPITADTIRNKCHTVGLAATVLETDGSSLSDTIRTTFEDQPEIVVAAGGDGTVSAVATALLQTDSSLGVLPLGTLNHFARDCGIPTDIDRAIEVLANERARPVDVGQVNDRIFINNASVGLYPKTVRLRDGISSRLGGNKWLAMLLAGLRVVGRFSTYDVTLRLNEEQLALTTPLVFVGNNEYSIAMPQLGERQSLADGHLHLLTADSAGRLQMAGLAVRALFHSTTDSDLIHHRLVTSFQLSSSKSQLRVALDGEVFSFEPPLAFSSMPGKLAVIRPPEQ